MSLRLYMDVHVPRAITEELRRRGIDVTTAQEDGHREADDSVLLARATELECVLFSRDEDLLRETASWQRSGRPFAGVIYGHQLRVTIGQAVNDLQLMARVLEPADLAGHVEHLPLR